MEYNGMARVNGYSSGQRLCSEYYPCEKENEMRYLQLLVIIMIFTCTACDSGNKPIEQKGIEGRWVVTNEEVDIEEFTTNYGQIHAWESMRVEQHLKEGMFVEFLSDGTVKFEDISGKYTLHSQDGYNYIDIIGDASESTHPIELRSNKLQLGLFILEPVTLD
ncbi:hypothetical protein [Paenibacillus glacialis]|uniref:Lipocalin-like domain-containing protein n=1 Tax=Paenibacillus glacialis TaxID=494026 RepID=A0A168N0D0_9BACL|nr:hypothetical protein [Paenibacillus glacialis]OAB45250.1 hypothetical protein PGLA_03030 [Paenibacillus glacialis]